MKYLQKIALAIKIFLLALLCGVVLFSIVMLIIHRVNLSKEAKKLSPAGDMVEYDDDSYHVYSQDCENPEGTIVMISDWGIADGSIAYKPLFSYLSEKFTCVYPERGGYGFSENTGKSRDIDTVLDETRGVLAAAGYEAPYILMPHAIGGLQAVYWAQKYPEEVIAIVGLDIGTPKMYEYIDEPDWLNSGMAFITKFGMHRFFGRFIFTSSRYSCYTWDELQLMKYLQIRSYYSGDMLGEIKLINENAAKSTALPTPVDIPLLAFAANPYLEDYCNLDEEVIAYNKEHPNNNMAQIYNNNYKTYFMQYKNYEIVEVPSDNLIYANQPELIAEKTIGFLENIE